MQCGPARWRLAEPALRVGPGVGGFPRRPFGKARQHVIGRNITRARFDAVSCDALASASWRHGAGNYYRVRVETTPDKKQPRRSEAESDGECASYITEFPPIALSFAASDRNCRASLHRDISRSQAQSNRPGYPGGPLRACDEFRRRNRAKNTQGRHSPRAKCRLETRQVTNQLTCHCQIAQNQGRPKELEAQIRVQQAVLRVFART